MTNFIEDVSRKLDKIQGYMAEGKNFGVIIVIAEEIPNEAVFISDMYAGTSNDGDSFTRRLLIACTKSLSIFLSNLFVKVEEQE